MNGFLVEASRWLWDFFLLATVLLAVVLVVGKPRLSIYVTPR